MIDRRYWITDNDWLTAYKFDGLTRSNFPDYSARDKASYLEKTKITKCPYCDGDLFRTFHRHTCGHGEVDLEIRYRCFGCTLDITESYGFGRGFNACDDSFMEKTQTIIDVILRRYNNVHSNSL